MCCAPEFFSDHEQSLGTVTTADALIENLRTEYLSLCQQSIVGPVVIKKLQAELQKFDAQAKMRRQKSA
jgi:hypothetical protein